MAKVQRASSGSEWEQTVGYSRAVRAGDRIVVSGTTAVRDGRVVGVGDAYAQTVCAIEIIEEALRRLGAGLDDVVRTRLYLTDISRWSEVGRAHAQAFGSARPAATMVEVRALIHPDLLVEVEAEALASAD